jgi:hypothetical protein
MLAGPFADHTEHEVYLRIVKKTVAAPEERKLPRARLSALGEEEEGIMIICDDRVALVFGGCCIQVKS